MLNLTRIMVAHRPETIASAERVVSLQNGKAVEIRATSIDRAELKPDQFESLAELQMLVA